VLVAFTAGQQRRSVLPGVLLLLTFLALVILFFFVAAFLGPRLLRFRGGNRTETVSNG
jgi:hypothetical protein